MSCFVCGESELAAVRKYRTNTAKGRRVFGRARIAKCTRCGLHQVDPRPDAEALARYYVSDYRRARLYGSDVADARTFPRDNLFYLNRGRSIVELTAPEISSEAPAVLDVGTGFGHVLWAFGERYPDSRRLAIEFSDVCVQHLNSIGVEVRVGPVEDVLPALDRRFDVITICHVLEHLLEPARVLTVLGDHLAADGLLYVEVPHIAEAAILGHPDNAWAPRYDEPHVGFFSPQSLRRLLEDSGYEVRFLDTAGPVYRHVSALRYALPPLRSTVQRMIPRRLFEFLRGLRATNAIRVQEREEAFYAYGGDRIWIRAMARTRRGPAAAQLPGA
jgi:SAM-dependent methyltransferase